MSGSYNVMCGESKRQMTHRASQLAIIAASKLDTVTPCGCLPQPGLRIVLHRDIPHLGAVLPHPTPHAEPTQHPRQCFAVQTFGGKAGFDTARRQRRTIVTTSTLPKQVR